MAIPNDIDARLFFRSGRERLEDAHVLLQSSPQRTTGAVYLAGYCVECLLKALVLSSEPKSRHPETLATFRGSKAHNYSWLQEQYQLRTGRVFPPRIQECLEILNAWGTSLRYVSATFSAAEADLFLKTTGEFSEWAESHL